MFDLVQFNENLLRKGNIAALISAVDHPNLYVRCSAINELGLLGSNQAVADSVPALIRALLNNKDLSSLMAAITLGKLGNHSLKPILSQTVQYGRNWIAAFQTGRNIPEQDTSLSQLFRALGNIGNPDCLNEILPIVDELIDYQSSPCINTELYRMTMLDAFTCIGKTKSESGVGVLIKAVDCMAESFQGTIIWALGQLGGMKARMKVWELVASSNDMLHHKAMETLSQELTIFLSSTFRDMQDDRDALIADCMPRLRKECDARGIKMTVIDLRWGITPEDTASMDSLIRACLHRIDQCQSRHFIFIGFLGYQYGHTCKWDRTGDFHSMTEIEILHTLTNSGNDRPRLSLFYLRELMQNENVKELSAQKAIELRNKVEELSQRYPNIKITDSYRSPDELSKCVYRDILRYLETTFPTMEVKDKVVRDVLDQYRWYSRQLNPAYIPQANDFQLLDSLMAQTMPVLLSGGEGTGKTSLMCHWTEQRATLSEKDLIIVHNLNLSPSEQRIKKLYEHLAWELARIMHEPFNIAFLEKLHDQKSTIPKLQALLQIFSTILENDKKLIILLDGFELDDYLMIDANWSIPHLPQNIRLIAFHRSEDQNSQRIDMQNLNKVFWNEIRFNSNINDLDIECIITRKLNTFGKELTFKQQKQILSMDQLKNPLFLQEVLSHLIRFAPKPDSGNFSFEDSVLSEIQVFSNVKNLQQLYYILLTKAMQKFGAVFLEVINFIADKTNGCSDDQISAWMNEKKHSIDSSMIFVLHDLFGDSLNYRTAHISLKNAYIQLVQECALGAAGIKEQIHTANTNLQSITPHAAEIEELIDSWNARARERNESFLQHQINSDDFNFTICVSSQKDGFKELEKAIQKAKDGTMILLEPGVYSIPRILEIKKRIAFVVDPMKNNEKNAEVVFTTSGRLKEMIRVDLSKVKPISSPSGVIPPLFLAEGITFRTDNVLSTLFVVKEGFIGIKDCSFIGCHDSEEIPDEGGFGIRLQKNSSGYAENSVFRGFSSCGVHIEEASDFFVHRCRFIDNAWGIIVNCNGNSGFVLECNFENNYFGGIHTAGRAEMIIFDNTITNSKGEGLNFSDACTIIAYNNVVRGSVYDNIRIGAQATVALVKNQSIDGYCYGINAYSQNRNTIIYRNQVYRNNLGGMKFNDAFQGRVLDNEIAYNLLTGITLSHHSYALVAYNSVHDNLQNGIGIFSDQPMPVGHNHCHSNGGMGILASKQAIPILARNLCENNSLSGFFVAHLEQNRLEENTSWGNKEFGIEVPYGRSFQESNFCLKNAFGNIGSIDYHEFGTR
ncbi:MAG: right-handed parallel beta-helix repeat-containing protein [Anaerolineaceae bacterium]